MGTDMYRVTQSIMVSEECLVPEFFSFTWKCIDLLQRALPIFKDIMILPMDQKINIKFLPEGFMGSFELLTQVINIDPSSYFSDFQLLTVMAHECVHAEQYFTNKTGFYLTEKTAYVRYQGVYHAVTPENFGDDGHPWEQEAYSRQNLLALSVWNKLFHGDYTCQQEFHTLSCVG